SVRAAAAQTAAGIAKEGGRSAQEAGSAATAAGAKAEEVTRRRNRRSQKTRGFTPAFFFNLAASGVGDSRRCRPARRLPRPADGGLDHRWYRAGGSAPTHRRRIRSPNSPRTNGKTAGP